MNAIMVDNWLMEEIVFDSFCPDMSEEYAKYLTAIVLWDEIYYPQNDLSFVWKQMPGAITSILKPIEDVGEQFEELAKQLYHSQYSNYPEIVARGAIRYLLFSNLCNCDYFPSGKRQRFLRENRPHEIIKRLTRFDYINILDSEINDCFRQMFEKFGQSDFRIKRPVLVDFIIQNTKPDESYIDSAVRLKKEKEVVQYRRYLSDIEDAIDKRNWNELYEMISYSEDIVRKAINLDKKNIGAIDVTIAPVPSIGFSKSLDLGRRKMHLSFLEDVCKFAFNGRKLE